MQVSGAGAGSEEEGRDGVGSVPTEASSCQQQVWAAPAAAAGVHIVLSLQLFSHWLPSHFTLFSALVLVTMILYHHNSLVSVKRPVLTASDPDTVDVLK